MPTTYPDFDLPEPPSEHRMLSPRPKDSHQLTVQAIANLSKGVLEAQRCRSGTRGLSALHEDAPRADMSTTPANLADSALIQQCLDTQPAPKPLTTEALQCLPEVERSSRTAEWLKDEDIPEE